MTDVPTGSRAGFCALIGAPNAGKSTLLNRMVGSKLSIVTHKVQTTRTRIRGVTIEGDAQIVFVDTPGIFSPRRRLDRAMVDAAWMGAEDADAICLLVDAAHFAQEEARERGSKSREDTFAIVERLKEIRREAVLVLNKIDAMARAKLLELVGEINDAGAFSDTFMISALKGDGVDDLRAHLAGRMPEGPWLYPPDQIGDITERLLAAEITREKLILRLHEELPYATTVETEAWKELKDGSARIEQTIYVERDSQKAIVLGKQGRAVKEIGRLAREELETVLDRRVHLFLFVKVRERWGDDPARYREMGLDFPSG